ncbi:hypothetical protein TNCV_337441 [Trichonephila clavipes]|nr:hypothetical protein TNCV_337441 [Trichonephila clavipes]
MGERLKTYIVKYSGVTENIRAFLQSQVLGPKTDFTKGYVLGVSQSLSSLEPLPPPFRNVEVAEEYVTPQTEKKVELRHENIITCYDFKAGLNQEECFQWLQLVFGDESPCRVTVFRWFKEVCRGRAILFKMKNTQEGHGG